MMMIWMMIIVQFSSQWLVIENEKIFIFQIHILWEFFPKFLLSDVFDCLMIDSFGD